MSDACQKCRTCFQLGCPALTIEDDAVKILEFLCHGCGLCAQVCRFDAVVPKGDER